MFVYIVELGYNDLTLCDARAVALYIV